MGWGGVGGGGGGGGKKNRNQMEGWVRDNDCCSPKQPYRLFFVPAKQRPCSCQLCPHCYMANCLEVNERIPGMRIS